VAHAVTTLLLTATIAYSLSARSGLSTGASVYVAPGSSHDCLSLFTLIALAAWTFETFVSYHNAT